MRDRRLLGRSLAAAALAAAGLAAGAGSAAAHDHLFDAATSPGSGARGFANPVAGNPSGVSGSMAQPASVPGLGNPNSASHTGTPAFSCQTLHVRLDARSSGMGPSCR